MTFKLFFKNSVMIILTYMIQNMSAQEVLDQYNDEVLAEVISSKEKKPPDFTDEYEENQNGTLPGHSNIFIYIYTNQPPDDIEIGNVKYNTPHESMVLWKQFEWYNALSHKFFDLNSNTGMITAKLKTESKANRKETSSRTYALAFKISIKTKKESLDDMIYNSTSSMNVTIQEISEKSAERSILVNVTIGEISQSLKNISHQMSLLELKFSTHKELNQHCKMPQEIKHIISKHQVKSETKLLIRNTNNTNIEDLLDIHIKEHNCEWNNTNILIKSNVTSVVFASTTTIFIDLVTFNYECISMKNNNQSNTSKNLCLQEEISQNICSSFDQPECAANGIGFSNDGWAMYPSIKFCETFSLSMELTPNKEDSLVLFVGPVTYNSSGMNYDFISFELNKGFPVLIMNYKGKSIKLEHKEKLINGKPHVIHINLENKVINIIVNNSNLEKSSAYFDSVEPFDLTGPLRIGNSLENQTQLAELFNLTHKPMESGYDGCIKYFTFNGQAYNLLKASSFKNIYFESQTSNDSVVIIVICSITFLIIAGLGIAWFLRTTRRQYGSYTLRNDFVTNDDHENMEDEESDL